MVSKIAKINIIALQKLKEPILDLLQDLGMVQIAQEERQEIPSISTSDIEYDLARTKFALDFLSRAQEKKPNFAEKILNPKIILSREKLKEVTCKFDYKKVSKDLENQEAILNEEENRIRKLEEEKEILISWKNLNFAPHKFTELKNFKGVLGAINASFYPQFLKELTSSVNLLNIEKIYRTETEKEVYLLIIFSLKEKVEDKIKEIFSKYDFKIIEFPRSDKPPRESLKQIEKEKRRAQDKIIRTEKEVKKYLKRQRDLKIIFDWLSWQKGKEKAKSGFFKTERTFSIAVWIEEENIERLKKEISKITHEFELSRLSIKKDESVPVLIKNSSFVEPLESVTSIYGMPKPDEPDPTPYLAPFFILFFALCLSDAGYGVILAFLSYLAIKLLKVPSEKQKFFKLLVYAGLATFVVGALLGGWFGIVIENLPQSLSGIKNLLLQIRLLDPVKNPIKMLILSLILGITQVMVGLGINLWWKMKKREFSRAFDSGLWLYFIASILFWLVVKVGIISQNLVPISKNLVLLGAVALIFTQGRRKKNIFLKFASGVTSLYSLVGYLSDVLSYSRLLALGLATAIIAMVVNLIAFLFKDMIPYIGWGVAVLVLTLGHLFNLAISALGAFIHSGRLQFVEFFPKFMEGGGKRFEPFKKEAKYIKLIK